MKKSTRLLVILFSMVSIFGSNVYAQDDKDKPAKIGIRAGWNYASMYIDNEELPGIAHNNAFYVGVFKEKKLAPFLRLGSGLEYLQNGYDVDDGSDRNIQYLSVPLYLKVKLGPVYATGGTGFNFKIAENLPGGASQDPLNNEKTNFYDMPFQLGAGLKIFMFSVEARYNWGILNVNNDASNQYLQVGFTVSF